MEAQCGRRARPEPALPPGLNREQAWAWALDNFPALSRPSCLSPEFCGDAHYCACGLPRHACPGPADGLRVEMGQKRWRDPQGQEPAASPGGSDSPIKKRPKPHGAGAQEGLNSPPLPAAAEAASLAAGSPPGGQDASHPTPHTLRLWKTDLKPGGSRQGKE